MNKNKAVVFLAVCISILFTGCLGKFYHYKKNPPKAVREGALKLPQLQGQVEVYYDDLGIPQFFTENEHDLFFSIGYVQAQDRLFEMVLLRAIAEGRLSELLGDLPLSISFGGMSFKPLEYDIHQRVWGIKYLGEIGEALSKKYRPDLYQQAQAFCDGINTYIKMNKDNLPVELQVMKVKPAEFKVGDVLSFGLFIGTMLGANYYEELFRYTLMKEYGWDFTWRMAPYTMQAGPTIIPPEMLKNRLPAPEKDILKDTPRPEDLGLSTKAVAALMKNELAVKETANWTYPFASNNWSVMGKLTTDGNAILCNDPHLTHMEPSLFYMMRVKGAGFDAYGVSFPGTPYIVLGHTPKLSWAATTTRADVQDVFIEKVNPENKNQYLHKGEWKDFTVREEEIRVRVGLTNKFKTKTIKIKQTVHGPVLNSILKMPKGTPPLALRWTGWDFGKDLRVFNALATSASQEEFLEKFEQLNKEKPVELMNIAAMYNTLMKGKSIEDFKKGVDSIVVPNQNWMAADSAGHIAYIPGGLVPVRAKGRGLVPVPGWTGEYDWTGFIPLMELPYAIDPPRGWMVTANNEVVDMEWYPYTFGSNYSFGWRAARIEELVKKMQPLDIEKMKQIQNDVYSKEGEAFAPKIVKAVENKGVTDPRLKEAAAILKNWDYQTGVDSIGASIYYAAMWKLFDNVLSDEFPRKFYDIYFGNRLFWVVLHQWVMAGESEFFDDKRTKDKIEDLDDMLVKSLKDATDWLSETQGRDMKGWRWGKIHTITFSNPIGMGPLSALNFGPLPHMGADQTVRNASFSHKKKTPFSASEGPVMRHIMNMGKPDEALMVIDGSESGKYLDPHYTDMTKMWHESKYQTAVMNEEKVKKNAKSLLVLSPE